MADGEGIYYQGVQLKDRILHSCSVEEGQSKDQPSKKRMRQEHTFIESLPEDLMAVLDQFNGDGKGRVSIGGELSTSLEFGFKASASVYISVTCDNSIETCEAVHDVVQPYVQRLIEQDHAKYADIRSDMIEALLKKSAPRLGPAPAPAPATGTAKAPPKKKKGGPLPRKAQAAPAQTKFAR